MARSTFTSGTSGVPKQTNLSAVMKQLPTTDEGQALIDCIDKSCATYSKYKQREKSSGSHQTGKVIALPTEMSPRHMGSVVNELMEVAGEAGMFGIMFKILALIKQRVDKVKVVDGKAESLNKLSEDIMLCFDYMKTRYTQSSSLDEQKSRFTVLEEEAVLLLSECAQVVGSVIPNASEEQLAGCRFWIDKVARPFRRCWTSSGNLEELDLCISKFEKFASKLLLEDQARTVNNDLPYLGGNTRVGTKFGQSVNELKQFVSPGNPQAKIYVVLITGPPGAGKSRLAKEIIHAIHTEQAESAAGVNNLKIELLQMDFSNTSGSHLEPVECQRKLLEQMADGRAAEGLSHKDVGYTKIRNALRAWKESSHGRKRKVIMFFDNAPMHTSVLSEILPDDISKLLPTGSCVILSMRGYDSVWKNSGVYERIQRLFPSSTCKHRLHEVKRLECLDARNLFEQFAGRLPDTNESAAWSDIIHDLVERCEGNPKLLVLFGKFFDSQRSSRMPSFWWDILKKLEDMDASAFSDEALDGLWKEHMSKASNDAAAERRKTDARFTAKLRLVYTMKLGECQDAMSDISNVFDGWNWKIVEAILGKDVLRKLREQKFVSLHVVFQNLYKDLGKGGYQICSSSDLAALTNKCGRRSPIQLKVVQANLELSDTARSINGDKHLRAVNCPIPEKLLHLQKGVSKNLRSLCLLNCEGKFQVRWLDRIQGLHYLILHNLQESEGVTVKPLKDLCYLYWGCMPKVRFPFDSENLPNLQTLVMTDFDFSSQPKVEIPSLLQNLSLIRCRNIHVVAPDIFRLTHLKFLHLQECEGSCEFTVAGRGQLKSHCPLSLSFQNCADMERIPTFIQKLQRLTDLGFISCPKLKAEGLDSAPEIKQNRHMSPSLRTVSFEDCRSLTCLPAELAPYSECLTELEIKSCRLQQISPHIAQFENLTKLTLASCPPLQALPSEIGDLSNLQRLSLEENRGLRSLPPEIGKLQSLKELKLDYCEGLQSLPVKLENLKRLSILSMSFCYGLDPTTDLSMLPDLRKLQELSHVNIRGLQPASVQQKLSESTKFLDPSQKRITLITDERKRGSRFDPFCSAGPPTPKKVESRKFRSYT